MVEVTEAERMARYLRRLAVCMKPLAKDSGFWAEANAPAALEDVAKHLTTAQAEIEALKAELAAESAEAETARYMREIAQELGYPTTLEALEDVSELRAKVESLPDYIELFRIIRAAGRSDREKARAVFAAVTPTLAETQPEGNPDNG